MSHNIWTEKYRPKTFSEVKGQEEVVKRVKALTEKKNLPHLMFAGPPGVGKTTLALVIARETFGEGWKSNFLELNASDERGIDIIRNKVKDFARTRSIGDVPYKIIYLDECDALTRDAQQALRRTMENFAQTTRFILSCNFSSKIIEPIQSRCTVFRFKPLKKEQIIEIIDLIAEKEGLTVKEGAKDALFDVTEGDARRVENVLQSCAAIQDEITEELVFSLASAAKPEEVKQVLQQALDGKFEDARDKLLKTMLDYGISGLDIIKQIQKEVVALDIAGRNKMEILVECGECEFRMSEGSDEFVQLEAFLAKVALVGKQ